MDNNTPLPTCKICGKTFKAGQGLGSHMSRTHGIQGARRNNDNSQNNQTKKVRKTQTIQIEQRDIHFCPNCGCNLKVFKIAAGIKP